ncbi:MAG: hypothetical protein EZS28_020223 [Streblomastix strix]|uniref:Uncharacterized protein n=1 Tax=Streblomastix strix TaxID=222440 RepID=A0A5J4VPJ5_9EUKA|nr:MAG: hypothetical protein EZS28_020223 [Streblomastix strix]
MLLIIALVTISFGWPFTNLFSLTFTKHKQIDKETNHINPSQVPFRNQTSANQFRTSNTYRSFAKSRKMSNIDITRLYFDDESIDQSYTVTVDYLKVDLETYYTGSAKIADFIPLNKTASTNDKSFYVIPINNFDNLKTNYALNENEKACDIVNDIHYYCYFGFYGYSVFAITNSDIAPSITGLVANGPSKYEFINVPPRETDNYFTNRTISKQCNTYDYYEYYLSYALKSSGIYDTQCRSNEQIPSDGTKCSNGTNPFSLLKGYQEGLFVDQDANAIKDLLIRFGVVYLYQFGLTIGWENDQWICVEEGYNGKYTIIHYQISQYIYMDGIVIFNKDKTYNNMEQCKSNAVPANSCLCNLQFHPAACTCSPNPEDLTGLSISLCKCLPLVDKRNDCIPKNCSNEQIPSQGCFCNRNFHPQNCTCPSNSNLKDIPISICGCQSSGDPREQCKICQGNIYDQVDPGSCTCGLNWEHHPTGCLCADQDDYNCVCSANQSYYCQTVCEQGQFPDYDDCLCRANDNICKDGPLPCTQQYHPRSCKCPHEADDLINVPKRICGCVYEDQREECQEGAIYYLVGTIDDNRVLELDYNKFDFELGNPVDFTKIADYEPYKEGISASDSSFLSISKEDFEKLKLTKALTQNEKKCEIVQQTREFYSCLGIVAKIMSDVDIAPSATYMVAAGPNKITISNVPQNEKEQFSDIEISQSCYDELVQFSLQFGLPKIGISDSTCFPNTGIPADVTKCADGKTTPEFHLKDYSTGGFEQANVKTMKEMLIRFGMVYTYYGIIIGWEDNNWVVAEQEYDTSYTLKTQRIYDIDYIGILFLKVKEQLPLDEEIKRSGLSTGALVGIIVAVLVVVAAIVVIIIVILYYLV